MEVDFMSSLPKWFNRQIRFPFIISRFPFRNWTFRSMKSICPRKRFALFGSKLIVHWWISRQTLRGLFSRNEAAFSISAIKFDWLRQNQGSSIKAHFLEWKAAPNTESSCHFKKTTTTKSTRNFRFMSSTLGQPKHQINQADGTKFL